MILLLEYLTWVTVFAIAVGWFVRVFHPRASIASLLWSIVLLKLLIPPLLFWPWSLSELMPSLAAQNQVASNSQSRLDTTVPVLASDAATPSIANVDDLRPLGVEGRLAAIATSPWATRMTYAAIAVWFAGSLVMVIRFGREVRVLYLFASRERSTDEELDQTVARISGQMGIALPSVHTVPNLASPVVFWLFGSRLLWPGRDNPEFDNLSNDELITLVTHELAHVRRGDHLLGWLESIAQIAWWWVPTASYVVRQLNHSCEVCCDQWVQRLHPNSVNCYASLLLRLLENNSKRQPALQLTHGVLASHSSLIRERMKSILNDQPTPALPWRSAILIPVVAFIMLPHLAVFGKHNQEHPNTTKPGSQSSTLPSDEDSTNPILEHMEYLVAEGGIWIADNPQFTVGSSQPKHFQYRFRWGPHRRYVKGEILGLYGSGKSETYSEIMIFWHPAEKTMQFHQYSADGSISKGVSQILADGNEKLEYTRTSSDATVTQHRYLNERMGQHDFVTHQEVSDGDGQWKTLPEIHWKRKPSKTLADQ